MTHHAETTDSSMTHRYRHQGGRGGSALYGVGTVGALVYYLQHATGFWDGVVGIVKALLWPAFVVYQLMVHLHM